MEIAPFMNLKCNTLGYLRPTRQGVRYEVTQEKMSLFGSSGVFWLGKELDMRGPRKTTVAFWKLCFLIFRLPLVG